MPILIKQIQADILDHITTEVELIGISGQAGEEDYIKFCTFEAFTQNLSRATDGTEEYPTPREFALLSNKERTFDLLEISY